MNKTLTFCMGVVAILLSACGQSKDEIVKKTENILANELGSYAKKEYFEAEVSNVTLVRQEKEGNSYEGIATLSEYGESIRLPIHVAADDSNVLVKFDLLPALQKISIDKWSKVVGKYPFDLFGRPDFKAAFSEDVRKIWPEITDRLSVSIPIVREGDYIFGAGCKAHFCGTDEAAFVIDSATGQGEMIYISSRGEGLGINAQAFTKASMTGGNLHKLPPPLLSWAIEHHVVQ